MSLRPSRRDLLRLAAFSGAGGLIPNLLTGCGSSSDSKERDPDDPGWTEFDPNRPWWQQGNYASVDGEAEALDLEVTGSIPASLNGLYARNGSNAQSGHWFVGDGMIHGVRLEGGKALWYRRRFVKTTLYENPDDGGPSVPGEDRNQSNVSLVHHAGRMLSLGEVGFPYELSPEDLSTVGVYDFDGALTSAMTAHPKLDAVTGEMLMFGYGFAPPYLTYHLVSPSGELVKSEGIDIGGPAMMHDFAITESHVIFMDLPITFDIGLVESGIPYKWNDSYAARLGVMPRNGSNDDVVWFDIEPCYVFHVMNAYEKDGEVVLEAVRHPRLWVKGSSDFESDPSLWRWRMNVETGIVAEEQIDDVDMEFPQLDRRLVGRPYRYGYGLRLGREQGEGIPAVTDAIVEIDHQTGQRQIHELPAGQQSDEAIFIPENDKSAEREGWMLSYVYDHARQLTDLVILDASAITKKPVARVKLPFRVPFGFHGIWIPA